MNAEIISLRPNRGTQLALTGNYVVAAYSWGESAIEVSQIEGPEIRGAIPGLRQRPSRSRSLTVDVEAATTAAFQSAWQALDLIIAQIQESGGWIVSQVPFPDGQVSEPLETEVIAVTASAPEDPVLLTQRFGRVELQFTTQPAWLADEALLASKTASTASTHRLTLPAARGNLPGPGRVKLIDKATTARRFVELGAAFESYVVGQSVEFRAAAFDLTGADGTLVTTAVTDKIGTNTISVSPLLPAWRTVGFLRSLPQKATQAVRARLLCVDDEVTVTVRALWRAGTGAWRELDTVEVPSGGWWDLAFGSISRYDEAATMDVRFDVKASASAVTSSTFRLNVANVTPTDMYVVARGKSSQSNAASPGAYDSAEGLTQGAALDGRTPAIAESGNWVGSGATGAFTVNTGLSGGAGWERTSGTETLGTGRIALISATAKTTTTVVGSVFTHSGALAKGEAAISGVLLRYVDASNFVVAALRVKNANGKATLKIVLYKRVAGTLTLIKEVEADEAGIGVVLANVRAVIDTSGNYEVWAGPYSDNLETPTRLISGTSAVMATGGALASGKVGAYAAATESGKAGRFRSLVSYSTASPSILTDVVRSGGIGELTHEAAYSADADGSNPQDISESRGKRIWVPPNLPGLLSAKVRSSDSKDEEDTGHSHSTDLYIYHRPAFATISDALE